jgi:hypothetical protein
MTYELKQKKPIDSIEVIIDKDKTLKYERVCLARKIFNSIFIIILVHTPTSITRSFIRKSSKKAAKVQNNVTTHTAIDVVYQSGIKFSKRFNFINEIINHTWFNLNNAKALRNRLKLVKKLLKQAVNLKVHEGKKEIIIYSLASGSSRAVIDIVKKFENNISFCIRLLDKDEGALKVSKNIIENKKLKSKDIKLIKDKVRNFSKYCNEGQPDIIEMVGLLDYLDEEKCLLILKKIFNNLAPNGILITANIRNNKERKFLDKVLKWIMVYREPDDLSSVLVRSGFKPENISIYYEPLLTHGVAIATK